MARPRVETETVKEENLSERLKRESIARFEERKARNSNLSGYNKKLEIDMELFQQIHPGMIPHWFRDKGGRLAQKFAIGWSFVPKDPRIAVGDPVPGGGDTDLGDRISVVAGEDSSKREGAYRLVLMMIPEEIHKQIVADKQKRNDAKDEEINRLIRGQQAGDSQGVENAYTPERGAGYYQP